MMEKQSSIKSASIKSEKKSISNTSLPRLNNNSTHNQLPRAASKAGEDAIDDYVDDFAGDVNDDIPEDEGAAAGGVEAIEDEVDDLDIAIPKAQGLNAKK